MIFASPHGICYWTVGSTCWLFICLTNHRRETNVIFAIWFRTVNQKWHTSHWQLNEVNVQYFCTFIFICNEIWRVIHPLVHLSSRSRSKAQNCVHYVLHMVHAWVHAPHLSSQVKCVLFGRTIERFVKLIAWIGTPGVRWVHDRSAAHMLSTVHIALLTLCWTMHVYMPCVKMSCFWCMNNINRFIYIHMNM